MRRKKKPRDFIQTKSINIFVLLKAGSMTAGAIFGKFVIDFGRLI